MQLAHLHKVSNSIQYLSSHVYNKVVCHIEYLAFTPLHCYLNLPEFHSIIYWYTGTNSINMCKFGFKESVINSVWHQWYHYWMCVQFVKQILVTSLVYILTFQFLLLFCYGIPACIQILQFLLLNCYFIQACIQTLDTNPSTLSVFYSIIHLDINPSTLSVFHSIMHSLHIHSLQFLLSCGYCTQACIQILIQALLLCG